MLQDRVQLKAYMFIKFSILPIWLISTAVGGASVWRSKGPTFNSWWIFHWLSCIDVLVQCLKYLQITILHTWFKITFNQGYNYTSLFILIKDIWAKPFKMPQDMWLNPMVTSSTNGTYWHCLCSATPDWRYRNKSFNNGLVVCSAV